MNIYDIYAPCINGATEQHDTYSLTGVSRGPVGGPDECIDSIAASNYLNQPDVMQALHVQKAPSGMLTIALLTFIIIDTENHSFIS